MPLHSGRKYDYGGAFIAALQFFTRLPLPANPHWQPQHDRQAAMYAPLVGCLIGLLAVLVLVLSIMFFPVALALIFSLTATTLLTGALHEDGFADFCDALGGNNNRHRTLAIMRDARIGTYGVLGTVLLLAMKITALISIANGATLPLLTLALLLITAHSLSRLICISFIYTHRYVRSQDAKGSRLAVPMSVPALLFSSACGIAPLFLFDWFSLTTFWSVILPLSLLWWWLAADFTRRLGGYTGDCLGTAQQLSESLIYLWGACIYVP